MRGPAGGCFPAQIDTDLVESTRTRRIRHRVLFSFYQIFQWQSADLAADEILDDADNAAAQQVVERVAEMIDMLALADQRWQ